MTKKIFEAIYALCDACDELRREHGSPVPDAIYRDVLRRRIWQQADNMRALLEAERDHAQQALAASRAREAQMRDVIARFMKFYRKSISVDIRDAAHAALTVSPAAALQAIREVQRAYYDLDRLDAGDEHAIRIDTAIKALRQHFGDIA